MRRGRQILLVVFAVILIGFIFYNVSSSLAIGPEDAKRKLKRGEFDAIVDVRTDTEWNTGHVPLAIHVPTKEIAEKLPQRVPDKNARILFYCNTSTRARMAAEQAQAMGYKNIRYLLGTHRNILP